MNDILANLNDAQRQAVTAPDGPVLVVAGAGSGKTRVLTTRIAWLLAEKDVMPGEILAYTFTNRAAGEMRERVANEVGPERAPFWIGTFHATGLKILRADGGSVGVSRNFSIYDTDDQKRLLKQVMADVNVDPKQFTPAGTLAAISRWKNDDTDPARAREGARSWVEERIADVYRGYAEGLARSVVVVVTSDESAVMRAKGAETAMSIAEVSRRVKISPVANWSSAAGSAANAGRP